jgi:uncharacterized repeat protein (TIGR01451 family)
VAWLAVLAGLGVSLFLVADAEAYSPKLLRYPYLTDVVGNSATVNWATDRSSSTGSVKWGTVQGGSCTVSSKSAAKTSITVGSTAEYQWKATLTLIPNTQYCYRVYFGTSPQQDLLGTDPSPRFFTQLPAGSSQPYTFAVFGNWGEVDSNGRNPQQANLMQQIAASGARFAVTTGDNAYNSGNQTNYGDLVQVGAETSAVFGPNFWTVPGASTPIFPALGNHGISTASTHFLNWPQTKAVSSSGGRYVSETYCCLNGTSSKKYGSAWYAFDAGNARFYVLEAAWADTNVGTATVHKNDYDYHWAPGTPEREWLEDDLAAHPSQLKFAFFQYPLYSDNHNRASDEELQGPDSLEGLLSKYNVDLAFNGDAHFYQRNHKAHPDSLVSYVTGGGGSKLAPIAEGGAVCSRVDAYGIGWSNSANGGAGRGSRCGAAPTPTAKDEVFHFLEVSVDGAHVTVTPINSLGQTFDPVTYDFSGEADLSVTTAGAPDPVHAWQTLTYTSTVTNNGPSPATGTALVQDLPADTSYESAAPSQGTCTHASGKVWCDLGELASGETATVDVNVIPHSEGTVASTVAVHADQFDPDTAGNYASDEVTVDTAAFQTYAFTPIADAYIRADLPNSNYGHTTSMITDATPEKEFLMKFDVSGIGGGEVVSATLRVYCVGGAVVTGGEFHGASNDWQETTVTWDTAPAANPIALSSLGPVAAGNWYEVDVTPLVTGDGTYTLHASSTSGDGADYSTKEGASGFAPQLLVTTL